VGRFSIIVHLEDTLVQEAIAFARSFLAKRGCRLEDIIEKRSFARNMAISAVTLSETKGLTVRPVLSPSASSDRLREAKSKDSSLRSE
jgi:hypothetical protein